MRRGFPCKIRLILPQAKISVSMSAWQHIYIAPGFLRDSHKQEVGCHVHQPRGLYADEVWLTTHRYFVYLSFPGY